MRQASQDRQRSRSRSQGRCPLCGQGAVSDYAPFCGKYCRDRDLLNWLDGSYRFANESPDIVPYSAEERQGAVEQPERAAD